MVLFGLCNCVLNDLVVWKKMVELLKSLEDQSMAWSNELGELMKGCKHGEVSLENLMHFGMTHRGIFMCLIV